MTPAAGSLQYGFNGDQLIATNQPQPTMNIQTDITVTPASLNKSSLNCLFRIAKEGTEEQKQTLLDWAYSSTSAIVHEELFFAATGEEWIID